MRVAVDLEDVIVDSNDYFVDRMNAFIAREFPEADIELRKSDIRGWKFEGLREPVAEFLGWKEQAARKFMQGHGDWEGYLPMTERIWREEHEKIPWVKEDIETSLNDLRDAVESRNGELHLVTARKGVRKSIIRKLQERRLDELFDDIVIESGKHRLQYDFYIDDNPNLFPKLSNNRVQLVRKQPWNREKSIFQPHRKVESIGESVEVIQDLG